MFECIQFIINTTMGIFAILFAGMGLSLWRKQLKGGDLYNYAKDALSELRQLLNLIEEYRYIFNTEEHENNIWIKIQDKFSSYETKMILLTILTKNKINDRNAKDYLTILYKNKIEKLFIIERNNKNEILDTERKELSKKLIEIDKVLKIRNEQDIFGNELNHYFEQMCEKLKEYIK